MKTVNELRINVIHGDITQVSTDAIVNAANASLMGGGGVDGAIHRAGGPAILNQCKEIVKVQGGCRIGEAVITTAGNMPSRFVIHTVGPIWRGGGRNESEKLADCYRNSLSIAIKTGCKSIAFPNISTGIYGYPKREAAEIAVKTVTSFLEDNNASMEVVFVCFDQENYVFMKYELDDYQPQNSM